MLKYLIIFFFLFNNFVFSQFRYASAPFTRSTIGSVEYRGPLVLPTARDIPIARSLKVEIKSSSANFNLKKSDIHVWINRYSYIYQYLGPVREDSTFLFTSNLSNPFVQFVFAPNKPGFDGNLERYSQIYGESPTIFVQFRDASGNAPTSVTVPEEVGFRITPNPVRNSYVEILVPVSVPRFNINTRFRVVNVDGIVLMDVPLIDLETDGPTIAFNGLRNGYYIAQLYNVPLGINRTYQFIISR